MALFYRPSPLFEVKVVREYRPNVLNFKVAMGAQQWYINGCCLAPNDFQTIKRVFTVLGDQPRSNALLVVGDLNTDLGATEKDRRGSEIAAVMTKAGVKDMTAHFLPRKQPWERERRTWSMVREGRVVRSRTKYLLGTDRSLFRNVSVRDPRHNTNHYMVVGHLRSATARDHARLIKGRRKMALKPPTEPMREDDLFEALRKAKPNRPSGKSTRTRGSQKRRLDSLTRESLREGGRE